MRQALRRGVGGSVKGLWFCASLAAALLAGCSTAKTVVVVTVSGQVEGISRLVVNLSAGGLTTTIYVPETPAPITLPTEFIIEMDRSRKGELRLDVDANNSDAQKVASGSATIPDVVVGERNEIALELIPLMPPDPGDGDAGADDDAGAADSGVTEDAGAIDSGTTDDAGEPEPDPDADDSAETAP